MSFNKFVSKKPKRITVQLVGGLGNQLFGYFAGLYMAQKLGCEVRFDVSQQDKGFSAHGSSILSFDLPNQFGVYERALLDPKRLFQRGLEVLADFVPATKPVVSKTLKAFTSKVVGFDPEFEKVQPGTFIRGYFQSHIYVTRVLNSIGSGGLRLKNPSPWFIKHSELAKAQKPVMVHVRRGDFAKLAEEFGMLSSEYYVAALKLIISQGQDSKAIWVFSDELENVRTELTAALEASGLLAETSWISPPQGTDAAESLVLMSLGSANVISNSTFSWWSAILNPKGMVVAPQKWFKGKDDPQDLIPESWIRLPSQWN